VVPDHDPNFPDDFSAALHWLVDHGAKVVNVSIGADGDAPPVDVDAIRYALSKDVVVVAGAGNIPQGNRRVITPARIPGVVAVSGVNRDATFWSGSVSGPEVVLSAPAVDMATTSTPAASRSGYSTATGTSFASPIVAATAALIRAKYPDLDAANVVNRLIATAKDQGTVGRDPQYGFGTVRILNALTSDVPRVNAYPISTPPAASPSGVVSAAPQAGHGSGFPAWLIVAVGVGLLVIIAIAVIVVAATGRRGRRPPPPTGYPPQPPYRTPPGQYPARRPPGTYGR
jgi:subtilisin family serine protease